MASIAPGDPAAGQQASGDDELGAIQRAGKHLVEGRIAEVPALLEPWLKQGECPDTYTLLAQAYVVAGRLPDAEALLRRAVERFPEARSVWKSLAVVFRTMMKPADELIYRRKLVYLTADPPLSAYVRLAEAAAAAYKQDPSAAQGDLRFVARKVAAQAPGDADERRERLALAQALYQIPDLKDEAYRLYAAADPAEPAQRDLGIGWVRLNDWCQQAGLPMQRAESQGRLGHRPTLAELPRVAVLPAFQWMPLLDEQGAAIAGFQMRRLVYRAADGNSPLLMHRSPDRAMLRLPGELPVHPGPALLLGGIAQYYHQTVEHLGTLAIAETLGIPPDLPLVVNHDLAPFQLEQFAMLGIGEDRLIRVPSEMPLRFERLWVASRPVLGGRWIDPIVAGWYRRRLALPEGPGHRKLYLSREGTGRRRVVNEAALVQWLATRGFEVVRPETLSVREQVALFAEASHIVAPTGAALTNMLYAPPGACVVAIYHRAFGSVDVDLYFDALAVSCGHRFASVLANAVAGHASGRTIDADIEVDIAALELALG